MAARKLHLNEQRMLKMIHAETVNGWAGVSDFVLPLAESLPTELVVIENVPHETCPNRIRLSPLGLQILEAMKWL